MAVGNCPNADVVWRRQIRLADKHYVPCSLQFGIPKHPPTVNRRLVSRFLSFRRNFVRTLDEFPLGKDQRARCPSHDLCMLLNWIAKYKVCGASRGNNFKCPNPMTQEMDCSEPFAGCFVCFEGVLPFLPNVFIHNKLSPEMLKCQFREAPAFGLGVSNEILELRTKGSEGCKCLNVDRAVIEAFTPALVNVLPQRHKSLLREFARIGLAEFLNLTNDCHQLRQERFSNDTEGVSTVHLEC